MLWAILYLIAGSLMVTPGKWQAIGGNGNRESTDMQIGNNETSPIQRVERIRVDFENKVNEILGQTSDISAYTFIVDRVDGNTVYIKGDSPNGYFRITLPENVKVLDINNVQLGRDGKKHFKSLPMKVVGRKVPFILGIVGDLNFEPNGNVKILKLEQVFFVAKAE